MHVLLFFFFPLPLFLLEAVTTVGCLWLTVIPPATPIFFLFFPLLFLGEKLPAFVTLFPLSFPLSRKNVERKGGGFFPPFPSVAG